MSVCRVECRELEDHEKELIKHIKRLGDEFIALTSKGSPREAALAKTKMEEAVMWAVKGISS